MNPARGEVAFTVAGRARALRPTFGALVAAEQELGSLYALVERASEGQLRLAEVAALFWHCLTERGDLTREEIGEAVMDAGLAGCTAPLRCLLGQILRGAAAG